MSNLTLGAKIKAARNNFGLTQSELANNCNLDIRTIQRIEQNKVIPRAYTLRILSDALSDNFLLHSNNETTDKQFQEYRNIFNRRKRLRIITFSFVLFLMIFVFIFGFPDWELFGMEKRVWSPYFYLIIMAHIIGIGFFWRCPGCNSLLGDVFKSNYCSKCGLKFLE